MRNLQALLAERDEEAKDLKNDRSSLEIESEGLQQRLKTLDESEHRLKEENWNLETKLQEISSLQRDAADREKKLTQALTTCNTEKVAAQKELDEVKLSHSKLLEEHAVSVKHHDIELGTAKRNIVMAESERSAMQRKIDDLTNQNQELAKAFSTQRGRTLEREHASGQSESEFETANDNITPEHSPPPSPVKGTPRHSMLETETMKTSLHHAQRTIQSQRSQIHREKTEKLELRRIIQDLRDDLERSRKDSSDATSNRRSRKVDPKDLKKNARLLGNFRPSKQEIFTEEDPEWEDHQAISPRASATNVSPTNLRAQDANTTDSTDQFNTANEFDTANEASESAFETAHERGTETEDFQTVNEAFSDDDDTATETETTSRGFGRMKRPPSLPAGLSRHMTRESFDSAVESTASTSADEDELPETRTPTVTLSAQKNRFRLSRINFGRNSRQASEEPSFKSSPASMSSAGETPTTVQQSLFAELQDFDGSDDESVQSINTPSRRSTRSVTPGSIRRRLSPIPPIPALPRAMMVDSGMLTDPVDIRDDLLLAPADDAQRPTSEGSVIPSIETDESSFLTVREDGVQATRPLSILSYSDSGAQHDPDMEASLAQFPVPPLFTPPTPPSLSLSEVQFEIVDPREEAELPPPALSFSFIVTQNDLEPIVEPEIPAPALSLSTITAEHFEPVADPEISARALSLSSIIAEHLEPIAEPDIVPPTLSISTIAAHSLEPRAEPDIPGPELTMVTILTEVVEPRAEPEIPAPELTMASILSEVVEPKAEPEIAVPELRIVSIQTEVVEPVAEPEVPATLLPTLALSSIMGEQVEPVIEPETSVLPPPVLAFSSIVGEVLEPVAEPESKSRAMPVVTTMAPEPEQSVPELSQLSMSSILTEKFEPVPESEVVITKPSLGFSSISTEAVEPLSEPEVMLPAPSLGLSSIISEQLAPKEVPEPAPTPLAYSHIAVEYVEPISEPPTSAPRLELSSIAAEYVSPIAERPPTLALSSITAENLSPIVERPPLLVLSSIIATEHVEPISEPETPAPILALSSITAECVSPITERPPRLVLSSISAENLSPIFELPPTLAISSIASEGIEPVSPLQTLTIPTFGFSSIESIETAPLSPRSPRRDGFILPRDKELPVTPKKQKSGSVFGLGNATDPPLSIAEDETRQPLRKRVEDAPEARRPFQQISNNIGTRSVPRISVPTSDQGAQTALTAEAIDQLFKSGSRHGHQKTLSANSIGTPGTTGTVRIHRPEDRTYSPTPQKRSMLDDLLQETGPIRRPGSAASNRSSIRDMPPLPANHRELIEAARSGSANGPQSNMGPPLWPASALKHRPHTPSQQRPTSGHSVRGPNSTPRAMGTYSAQSHRDSDFRSQSRLTAISRQSSVSSFGDEIDNRFNMRQGGDIDPTGFGPNTDPRMIQAITQTMIGEYLWKYTRKTGRGEMSEKRHRRYFWVHPYTRTLYWSDRDPSTAGRHELKAKSVPIEAVRVVTDDNPMPPGLHRKSLVIISPGRTIKFTCTTGQRHETWFNALSYLLLRTNTADGQSDAEEMVQNITQEDVDEFNPQYGARPVNGTRLRAVPSMSSYHSRTTQQSPTPDISIPTLTPNGPEKRASQGTLSRVSGYFKSGGKKMSGNFSSRRGRGHLSAQSFYEASEVHDSAEDLREIIERQDRDADRLENVRACCDGKTPIHKYGDCFVANMDVLGKHDVGMLHHSSKRGRATHTHSHPGQSTNATPMASMRSRA